MNNEKYNQIIDEVYENYLINFKPSTCPTNLDVQPEYYEPISKERFIELIKYSYSFSKWNGLKIEERELSLLERYELMKKLDNWVSVHYKEPKTMEYMDIQNIPTKLITITYNDIKTEIYE